MKPKDQFKIEKNVPIPNGQSRYPWDKMEVGDSFLCKENAIRQSVANAAQAAGKRRGWHFAVRATKEGVRVWRDK